MINNAEDEFEVSKIKQKNKEYEIYLKTNMKLYDINYFVNSYNNIKIKPVRFQDVQKISMYHYLDEEPAEKAAKFFKLNKKGVGKVPGFVLDIGSGLCGPARHLTSQYNTIVEGIEIQSDYVEKSKELNKEFCLENRIIVNETNFLNTTAVDCYKNIISILCLLHIKEKDKLFQRISDCSKLGGKVFIEDFFLKGKMTLREKLMLESCISCEKLDSKEKYISRLEENGYEVVFEEMTNRWTDFVCVRSEKFAMNTLNKKIHGDRVYNGIKLFYDVIQELFQGGNLGGCRIYAVKKKKLLNRVMIV